MSAEKHIVLIIGGGIAAYRALELIRLLRKQGHAVHPVLTAGARQFITPLSAASLAGQKAFTDLFSLTDETEMGHIRLARWADLIIAAPATANLMARAANGLADDLATTILLATAAPVLFAPAMNPRMWQHPATQRNVARLAADGAHFIGPEEGEVACGEHGEGRMAEPEAIARRAAALLRPSSQPLAGRHVLITAGPTHEPIDPVRVLANRSSGRMGFALAEAARDLGARVTLISGPTCLPDPPGLCTVRVETAAQMLAAVRGVLPADMAIFAAAVADWRARNASAAKIKKGDGGPPVIELEENPDILATVAALPEGERPALVAGFAAETDDVLANARAKLERKRADAIIANDVSPDTGILGGAETELHLITAETEHHLPRQPKAQAAQAVLEHLADLLEKTSN